MLNTCDYLFSGGLLVDGSGEPGRFADVAVAGERIVAIGTNLKDEYKPGRSFDITGKVICPGFIDIHTHSDLTVLINPLMESSVHQGVTTELVGNCGLSIGLANRGSAFEMERRWAERGGVSLDWSDMASFLSRIDSSGVAINIATLAGHGTIRKSVMGYSENAPNASELSQMGDLVTAAMEQGAVGLSSGLEYLPGGYAKVDELAQLANIVRDAGGFYASHIRDERDNLVSSVEEALAVGRLSHLPVQLSHHKVERRRNWGRIRETLGMMRDARASGMDVSTDQYPYTAFMTGLSVILLPSWAQGGSGPDVAQRLKDPESRSRIVDHIVEDNPDWDEIRIGIARNRPEVQGLTLKALAGRENKSPIDAALDLIIDEEGMVSAAYFAMSEDDVEEIMRDPYTMVGSDGVSSSPVGALSEGLTHPRTYGTFPRVLGEYVRRREVISLEEAIRKMTSLPASRLRLKERGCIEPGYFADLVVFNPETIHDDATFDEPHKFATGIDHVIVNGSLALINGIQTNARGGRVLRR